MRPRPVRPPALALALLLAAACGGKPTPQIPVTELQPGRDTLHVLFGEATQGAWLGGQRWAVISPFNATVAVVDFGARTTAPLGGMGGTAFQHPSTMFTLAESLFVNDWGLRRTTVWSPDGRMVRTIPASDVVRGALPHAIDGMGRLYFELAPPAKPDGSGNRDSAAVVRMAPGAARLDTLARLGPLDLVEVNGDAGRRFERRVFSGQDAWGVLPDGSVWVARAYQNRVDWRGPDGRVIKGALLPDRVLEVSTGDRDLFVQRFPPELRSTAEKLPYAAIKPPFETAFTGARSDVWLEKSQAIRDSSRRYHVVGRDGQPIREVRASGYWARVLASSGSAVLVADPDSSGFRLTEAALPTTPGSVR